VQRIPPIKGWSEEITPVKGLKKANVAFSKKALKKATSAFLIFFHLFA